jgi:IclR family mhp operon transcriptional activator
VRSALGKAILATSPPALRREMLDLTASLVEEDAGLAKDRRFIEDILLQTKKDGYASSDGGSEAGISIPGGGPVRSAERYAHRRTGEARNTRLPAARRGC